MTEALPERKEKQIMARKNRQEPIASRDELLKKIEDNKTLIFILVLINLAILGFLIGMFVSYVFF